MPYGLSPPSPNSEAGMPDNTNSPPSVNTFLDDFDHMLLAWIARRGGSLVKLEADVLRFLPRTVLADAIWRLKDGGFLRIDPCWNGGDGWLHLAEEVAA